MLRAAMAPLIPYIDIPPLHIFGPVQIGDFTLGELSIKPFGTLVAIGVFVGSELAKRTAERRGMDAKMLSTFIFYVLVGGFIGGHVLDTIFYHPNHLLRSPLSLLRIWDGQSSFGGFTGAFVGLLVFRHRFKEAVLPYADTMASGFPMGWVFGRTGCSVAHDHPGMLSQAWFAVQYPGGARFDLGLYEMLLSVPLALTFLVLSKKPRPPGFFLGVMCMAYAPTRFALDFLRARENEVLGADPRYGGLTPAQWGCTILLLAGVYFAYRAGTSVERGETHLAPPAPPLASPDSSGKAGAGDSTTESAQSA